MARLEVRLGVGAPETSTAAAWRSARNIGAGLLLVSALVGALRLSASSENYTAIDFYQYWALGQAVEEQLVPNIYLKASQRRVAKIFLQRALKTGNRPQKVVAYHRRGALQAASTPFLYTVFHAIQTGDYDRDIANYRRATLLGSVASVLVLCWLLGATPLQAAGALAFLCWLFTPLRDDLAEGNVNQIQLLFLTGFLWLHKAKHSALRVVAAGVVLGLAAFFKPNLAFSFLCLALGFALSGRWLALARCSVGVALGAVFAMLVSSLFFGSAQAWLQWFDMLLHLDKTFDVAVHWGNFGGARLLRDALDVDLTLGLNAVLLAIVCTAFWRSRAGWAQDRHYYGDFLMVSIGAVIPVLSMALAWPHYLLLAVPLLLYLLVGPVGGPYWRRSLTGGVLGGIAALALLGISSEMIMDALEVPAGYSRAVVLALGTLLLFGLGVGELLRPRAGEAQAE